MHKTKYPFCLFTIKEDWARVIREVTNSCNYSCSYCIFSSKRWNTQYDVPTNRMKETLLELRNNNVKYLKVTGWEPFIREDLIEILQYASDIWLEIDISTNASFLTEEKIIALKNINISYVHVSLDGHTKDMQELIRWKATFEPTIKGIKKLIHHNIHVRVGTVLYSGNEEYIEDIIKYILWLGVTHIIFSYMEPVGKLRDNEASVLLAKTDQDIMTTILEWLQQKYKKEIRIDFSFVEDTSTDDNWCNLCPGWKEFMFLDHKGHLSACTWIAEYFPQFISKNTLHTKSFTELINDTPMSSYFAFIKKLATYGIVWCPKRNLSTVKEILAIDNFLQNPNKTQILKKKFTSTHAIYSFTTENIAGYIKNINCINKNILTIGWSGDHIFNAYLLWANHVTGIDKNIFAKYFTELKRQAICHLNYQDFIHFFMNLDHIDTFSYTTYQRLRVYLSIESQYFWDELYLLYNNNWYILRTSEFFDITYDIASYKIAYNMYLENNKQYTLLQKVLQKKIFTRVTQGIEIYVTEKKYDIILLWNISDYTHLLYWGDHLKMYKESIIQRLYNHLNTWWLIQCAYIYDYHTDRKAYRNDIDNPSIRDIIFPESSYIKTTFHTALIWKETDDAIIYIIKT